MPGKRQSSRRNLRLGKSLAIHPALRMLPRANKLIEAGQHKEAANIYQSLARKAEDRGMVRVAPNLYLQAGRAHLLAGNQQEGAELVKYGLSILEKTNRWVALHRTSQQICAELDQLGFSNLVEPILDWTRQVLPTTFSPVQGVQLERGQVPLRCPVCQAVLKPGEFELISENNIECPFCGSQITTGGLETGK